MPLSFPLNVSEFFGGLKVASARFALEEYTEVSETSAGTMIINEIGDPKWTAEVTLAALGREEGRQVAALMRRIGAEGTFHIYDTYAAYPAADPDGAILGSALPEIAGLGGNGRSLSLSGLPAGYVLTPGDRFSVTFGSSPTRRAYFEVAEDATASGGGVTNTFDVTPWLGDGIIPGLAVDLIRPAARMRFRSMDAAGYSGPVERTALTGVTFVAVETE